MNPYILISSNVSAPGAADLAARLTEWHDAMVTHQRLQRLGRPSACNDECAHAEARALWKESQAMFGDAAQQLVFLRTCAVTARKAA